ncbi:MAG: transcriptional regulator [Candidatus Cryptobacteroides sp.]
MRKDEISYTLNTDVPSSVLMRRNSLAVRWYILVLPGGAKGSPSKGLRDELCRRSRDGEPLFEYFAPTYFEMVHRDGQLVRSERPLMFNYLFVRASEREIYRMKQYQPQYNFLTRVTGADGIEHHPFLSDTSMENLRWVARSYSDRLPVYYPDPGRLMNGDRIRITDGQFKGVEASVMIRPGGGDKDIMVCLDNFMWVPLLSVKPGQYEVIGLHDGGRHIYTKLGGDRIPDGLHDALCRLRGNGDVTDSDRKLAGEAVCLYGHLELDGDVMRSKQYSVLLHSYAILEDETNYRSLLDTVRGILDAVKASQSRALLLVTLYGCTDNSRYRNDALEILSALSSPPKKSVARLLRWIGDFDKCYGHKGI